MSQIKKFHDRSIEIEIHIIEIHYKIKYRVN